MYCTLLTPGFTGKEPLKTTNVPLNWGDSNNCRFSPFFLLHWCDTSLIITSLQRSPVNRSHRSLTDVQKTWESFHVARKSACAQPRTPPKTLRSGWGPNRCLVCPEECNALYFHWHSEATGFLKEPPTSSYPHTWPTQTNIRPNVWGKTLKS